MYDLLLFIACHTTIPEFRKIRQIHDFQIQPSWLILERFHNMPHTKLNLYQFYVINTTYCLGPNIITRLAENPKWGILSTQLCRAYEIVQSVRKMAVQSVRYYNGFLAHFGSYRSSLLILRGTIICAYINNYIARKVLHGHNLAYF